MQENTMLRTGNGLPGPKQMDHELRQSSFLKFSNNGNGGRTSCGESGSSDSDSDSDVAQTVRCACCEVAEDCTAAYIRRVRAAHGGSWVCGLCAEAVGERLRHEPGGGMEAALRWHMAVCSDFNATTRLNPKLSLAGSMRDIARRSFNRRASATTSSALPRQWRGLSAASLASLRDRLIASSRTISCQPRIFA